MEILEKTFDMNLEEFGEGEYIACYMGLLKEGKHKLTVVTRKEGQVLFVEELKNSSHII